MCDGVDECFYGLHLLNDVRNDERTATQQAMP